MTTFNKGAKHMILLHIADLHIGKRVNEFSMLEDQEFILEEILRIVDEVKPLGILMAGDIYDKSVPTGEAVEVLDDFLTSLVARKVQVFIVSGNHDSPERLNFGSRIMQNNGVYIVGTFDGTLKQISLCDEFGPVNIYLLPFVKPSMVNIGVRNNPGILISGHDLKDLDELLKQTEGTGVVLALLSLGVKNIHLGPTLPAFLSPNVAKILIETFGIAGISTVEDDLASMIG